MIFFFYLEFIPNGIKKGKHFKRTVQSVQNIGLLDIKKCHRINQKKSDLAAYANGNLRAPLKSFVVCNIHEVQSGSKRRDDRPTIQPNRPSGDTNNRELKKLALNMHQSLCPEEGNSVILPF